MQFGYEWAFAFNAMSFLFSAANIMSLRAKSGSFRAQRAKGLTEAEVVRPWHEYIEGFHEGLEEACVFPALRRAGQLTGFSWTRCWSGIPTAAHFR